MMPARSLLDTITRQVSELTCCDAAMLAIDCPVPELRHPLLSLFPSTTPGTARYYGAVYLTEFLRDERVRAACDIACQLGEISYLSPRVGSQERALPLAIAPLAGPAGLLGFFLLADPDGFTRGNDALLREYTRSILQDLEKAVRALLISRLVQLAARGNVKGELEWQHLPEALSSISIVSHELRAPLAAIKGYAGLLQAYSVADARPESGETGTVLTPAHQQRYLDMIMEETRHLEELIADLLDASRMQSGRLTLRFSSVDVGEACRRAAQRARQRIDQLQHTQPRLECSIAPHLPPIRADATRLQHILNNLLDNAIKYSPRGGTIKLAADVITTPAASEQEAETRAIRIVVRDQGLGIPPGQRSRLFQPFSRIDHPQLSQAQGVGLGLYISRQLVEAMQGTIDVSSQADVGTEVTLRFPVERKQLVINDNSFVLQSGLAITPGL